MATVVPPGIEQVVIPSLVYREALATIAMTEIDEKQLHFYIFGQGISFSLSPAIHTAVFRHYALPHTYEIAQTENVDQVAHLIEMPNFGGASVTMPHKLAVHKFCDKITSDAIAIGAINTLIVEKASHPTAQRRIIGANTDWSGLVSLISVRYSDVSVKPRTGLVIGAGGAARAAIYALHMAGVQKIVLVNRTRSNAESVAQHFEALFRVTVLDSLQALCEKPELAPEVIIGTIPADTTKVDDFPSGIFARSKGICMDMSYKPRITPLLRKAAGRDGWTKVTGVEILLSQASDQSQMWLQNPAPDEEMKKALDLGEKNLAQRSESVL